MEIGIPACCFMKHTSLVVFQVHTHVQSNDTYLIDLGRSIPKEDSTQEEVSEPILVDCETNQEEKSVPVVVLVVVAVVGRLVVVSMLMVVVAAVVTWLVVVAVLAVVFLTLGGCLVVDLVMMTDLETLKVVIFSQYVYMSLSSTGFLSAL